MDEETAVEAGEAAHDEALGPLAATQVATEAARGAIEKARAQRDDLLVLAGHDFKNAVGIVESALVMMDDAPDLAPSMYAMIRRATHRLGILARILADLDLLERGLMPLTPVPSRWKTLVTTAIEHCEPAATTKELGVRPSGALDAALVCDASLVDRILAALLDHAIGNAPNGSVIDVDGERVGPGRFRVRIGHGGRPVPKEALARYFATLPLRFCRVAVARHGGEIRAVSPHVDGGGMAFELELEA